MIDALVLDASDNVATALRDLDAGAPIAPQAPEGPLPAVVPTVAIAAGHKLALVPLEAGTPVRKYGEIIGTATRAVTTGEHVHVHNVASRRARR